MKSIFFLSILLFSYYNAFGQENSSLIEYINIQSEPIWEFKDVKNILNSRIQEKTISAIKTETPLKLVQQQLDAYNSGDIDAFLEPFSKDIEIFDFPSKTPHIKGKKNMRLNYAYLFNRHPNLYIEVVSRIVLGNTVIDRERMSGFQGKKIIEEIVIYKIENNKISKMYLMPKGAAENLEGSTFVEQFDNFLTKNLPDDEPGGAVLVMKNKKILFSKGYGLADMKTKEKITPKTVFNTGSISKTFVSNAILKLSEEGKLSLNDSLYQYFKDFKKPEIAKKVKIYHLLTHTSGLKDSRDFYGQSEFFLTAKDKGNFAPIKKNDALNFEPGEKFEYSNPAFNGLALIIEKVTGMKWQDYIRKNIFIPSKMFTSTITDGPEPSKGVSHAYSFRNGRWEENDYGEEVAFAAAGNGGIWTTPLELANYELALQNNIFLSKSMFKKSRSIFVPNNWADSSKSPFIGYSWFIGDSSNVIDDSVIKDNEILGHTGGQGGFTAFYYVIPNQNIIYIALFNRNMTRAEFKAFRNVGLKLMKKHGILK